jgi:hypothetical protein
MSQIARRLSVPLLVVLGLLVSVLLVLIPTDGASAAAPAGRVHGAALCYPSDE